MYKSTRRIPPTACASHLNSKIKNNNNSIYVFWKSLLRKLMSFLLRCTCCRNPHVQQYTSDSSNRVRLASISFSCAGLRDVPAPLAQGYWSFVVPLEFLRHTDSVADALRFCTSAQTYSPVAELSSLARYMVMRRPRLPTNVKGCPVGGDRM